MLQLVLLASCCSSTAQSPASFGDEYVLFDQLAVEVLGDAAQVYLDGATSKVLAEAEEIAKKAGDSFVPVERILMALALVKSGAWLFALVKPQFEAGKQAVGKGGIVRDPEVRAKVFDDICQWLEEDQGWTIAGRIASPITGSDGNVEFIVAARAP